MGDMPMTDKVRGITGSVRHRLDEIRRLVAGHNKVSDVVNWLSSAGRKDAPLDVVTQDEFTHDITVNLDENIYLVYDAT
jgi:hypothetical protein